MLDRALNALRDVSIAVHAMRAPLAIGIIAFFVLSGPAQVREIYLIIARSFGDIPVQALFAYCSLILLAFFLASASRSLGRANRHMAERAARRASSQVFRVLPIVIGCLPLLGACLGLYRSLVSILTPTTRSAIDTIASLKSQEMVGRSIDRLLAASAPNVPIPVGLDLEKLNKRIAFTVEPSILNLPSVVTETATGIYCGIALCVFAGMALAIYFARAKDLSTLESRDHAFHPIVSGGIALSFIALTAATAAQYLNAGVDNAIDYTAIPRLLGTLTLLNLCLMCLVFLATVLTRWTDRHSIPLITPLLALALVFSIANWNDNHDVRIVESAPEEVAARFLGKRDQLASVSEAFHAWYLSRPEAYRKKFQGKPYPVYVVAAQGGGMYASNMAGIALARLYDLCPAIRHHLFAISGVSGGSVGAGYLAALLHSAGAEDSPADTCGMEPKGAGAGPIEQKITEILAEDFLSPVAASFFFPDLLQRFLPVPVEAFDRARAFEAGLEQTWSKIMKAKGNPLREPLWKIWSPAGNVPVLFFNATIVESGRQVAISPVSIARTSSPSDTTLRSLHETIGLEAIQDVSLSTAMSLSARFPLVMPAGYIATTKRKVRLVDGGYYENSGIETATSIIQRISGKNCPELRQLACPQDGHGSQGNAPFAFRTIILSDFDGWRDLYEADGFFEAEPGGLNEVLSPLRAMLNTRTSRAESIVSNLTSYKVLGYGSDKTTPVAIPILVNQRLYNLPLGWQISKEVQEIISAQVGDPMLCVRTSEADFNDVILEIAQVERGFQLIAADQAKRPFKERRYESPFIEILRKLQQNHCALFETLALDGLLD